MNCCLLQTFQWQTMASKACFISVNLTQTAIVSAPFLVNGFLSFVVSIQEKSCSQSYHSFLTIDSIRKAKREDLTLLMEILQTPTCRVTMYLTSLVCSLVVTWMIMQSQKMISPPRQDFPAKKVQVRTVLFKPLPSTICIASRYIQDF